MTTGCKLTSYWYVVQRACMRLAPPMPGCGMLPSPPISLLVSTMTTRRWCSSDSSLAISRTLVVFPTPGRPCAHSLALSPPHHSDFALSATLPHASREFISLM